MELQDKFTTNSDLSITSALSRGCRICHFLKENGHFNIIVLCFRLSRAKSHKNFVFKAPLES